MSWQSMAITRVRRRSFAEPLVHGGAALVMPKFVHRESIGRLKMPRGTVPLNTSAVQGQTAVAAYFSSTQLLLLGFA